MPIPDFQTFPVWTNLAIFAGAAVIVWIAGTKLAYQADAISERTNLGKAFVGLILLGVATSLPEIATTVTAALLGNIPLLTGNLLGGVALQTTLLAIVDVVAVSGALTFFTPQPVLLFQGVMQLLLLSIALAGAAAGEPVSIAGLGLTSVLLAIGYALTITWSRPENDLLPRWRATNPPAETSVEQRAQPSALRHLTTPVLFASAAVSALVILVAGWTLAQTGDSLAGQTGLGASFVGVALLAASTSLPELSTSLAAVRAGNHQMAVSNILGTNCLTVALFFLGDAVYREGPVLAATDTSALFAGALAMVLTCIYLVGLLERRDRTFLRMGYDSVAVLVTYSAGLVGLYFLR